MSIEAMKLALEAVQDLRGYRPDIDSAIETLRTAIQQAEAQQPATPEPVMDVRCEGCGYMTHHREHMGCVRAAKQHTHPASSVPDDSKRLNYLQDRGATIDLIAGVAGFYPMQFRVGGLHSSANIDVRAAIDAAMLAANEGGK